MEFPQELFYTKEHEWAKIEGNQATFGISDYAQHSLGDITYVDLPKPGKVLEQFKFCATVESVKAASDIFTPLSGTVSKVNADLAAHPEVINKSPYENGWLCVVELKDPAEKSKLMTAAQYSEYVKGLEK